MGWVGRKPPPRGGRWIEGRIHIWDGERIDAPPASRVEEECMQATKGGAPRGPRPRFALVIAHPSPINESNRREGDGAPS